MDLLPWYIKRELSTFISGIYYLEHSKCSNFVSILLLVGKLLKRINTSSIKTRVVKELEY